MELIYTDGCCNNSLSIDGKESIDMNMEDFRKVIISIDVYLSGGQIITIDISEENYDHEDLQEILGYDPNYWNDIYSEETNTRSITKEIKDRKPIKTYNPYE